MSYLDEFQTRLNVVRETTIFEEFIEAWEWTTGDSASEDKMGNAVAFFLDWLRDGYIPAFLQYYRNHKSKGIPTLI